VPFPKLLQSRQIWWHLLGIAGGLQSRHGVLGLDAAAQLFPGPGLSKGAGKAGHARGNSPAGATLWLLIQQKVREACSSLLSTPLQILSGQCTVTAQRKI